MKHSPKRRGFTRSAKFALVFGLAALAVAFIPLAGDVLTIPLAITSIILGCYEIWRAERGKVANVVPATFGTIFGAFALFTAVMMLISTQDAA